MGLGLNIVDSAAFPRTSQPQWLVDAERYGRAIAIFILLSLPSLWLLTRPFPWMSLLEAMALGTIAPLIVFGSIGGLRLIWRSDSVSAVECAAITLCFACLQAYIFNTGLHPENRFNLVGGLLPNADPSMYLSLANQWYDGSRASFTARQFFPCLLSTMLWICGRDLKLIVSLFTLITGALSFLAWRQVRMLFGWLGATLFVALVFFFYRTHVVGLLRTEQLGLWFALIAVALFLQAIRERREGLWCAGLFSLVMGLNTRAGTYFMVPLLILYGGWLFRRGRWGWRSITLAAAVCFAGMFLDLVWYWIFFAPPRPPSNFWLCFYGMLKGGNWITAMKEVGHNYTLAQERALRLASAKPWLVLKGFLKACWWVWLTNTFYYTPPTAEVFRSCVKWLTLGGALVPWTWSVVQRRRAELEWFVLVVVLGTLLSLPFAPPWDGGPRVYAVAFPFIYLAPVMLIGWTVSKLRNLMSLWLKSGDLFVRKGVVTTAGERFTLLTQASLAILVLLSTVVPLGLMLSHRYVNKGDIIIFCPPVPDGCPANSLPAGYQIHLISDTRRTFVPWIRVSDFRKNVNDSWEAVLAPWLVDLFDDLPEGSTIATASLSGFFVIGTDKAPTARISKRHAITDPAWHRVIYDNDFPLSAYARQILSQAKAPPPLSAP